MLRFRQIFGATKCSVVGMIHVGALPGTPNNTESVEKLVENACSDSEIYKSSNIDGVLLENMHDIPYVQSRDMGPETVSIMTRICSEVRRTLSEDIPCGVQILAGGNKEAVAVALASGLQFVRAEGYVFAHVADEGFTDACAGPLMRYRNNIGAKNILVFTDIKKKHSAHSITADVSLVETAKAAEFFQTDGVIITGTATGEPADVTDFKDVKKYASGPVLVGSGVTLANVGDYLASDAVIVGTHFKRDGRWQNEVDRDRVLRFMDKINNLRQNVRHNSVTVNAL